MAFYAGGQSENYIQKVNQGDSYSFTVGLKDDKTGELIPFETGDILRYTVRTNYRSSDIVLQKEISVFTSDGKAEVIVLSTDTDNIEVDKYVYDIELSKNDGQVITIIPDSRTVCVLPTLEVCPQVSRRI